MLTFTRGTKIAEPTSVEEKSANETSTLTSTTSQPLTFVRDALDYIADKFGKVDEYESRHTTQTEIIFRLAKESDEKSLQELIVQNKGFFVGRVWIYCRY